MADIRVAVIGAGVIGRTHIETLNRVEGLHLSALVEPSPNAGPLADSLQVPLYRDYVDMIAAKAADAAIVASPNATHVEIAIELLAAGLPVLLEKPVAHNITEGRRLEAAVAASNVPLLVGHHRRHNPLIKRAKRAIADGEIGNLVMATVTCSLMKPPPYFEAAWRVAPGEGGPLLINMIHEVDLLRHFFGEVATVQGLATNAVRDRDVEDTAAALLQFRDGGMATLAISDAAVGPWAWDLSAGENPSRFPQHDVVAHLYAGDRGGLSLPDLSLWRHSNELDWTKKLAASILTYQPADSYAAQLGHFADLIRGKGTPLVTCRDGVANMEVIVAIKDASASKTMVALT